MSTIQTITSAIEALPITGGQLTITPQDFNDPFMDVVFSSLLHVSTLTFGNATKQTSAESATLSGTVSLFGYPALTCTLSFTVSNGEVVASLDASLGDGQTIQIPVLTWLKTGLPTISTSVTETIELVDYSFGLDILLENNDHFPISLSHESADSWSLGMASNTAQTVTVDDLVYLVGGQALENFLPSSLTSILAGIVLQRLEGSLNTSEMVLESFSVAISATNGWAIVPKLVELKPGLAVDLTLSTLTTVPTTDPSDQTAATPTTSLQAIGSVSATFTLGTVDVPITVGAVVGGGSNQWCFGLQTGKSVLFPSFSDLLELAGGEDFFATLPPGLSDIPQIEVSRLVVEFDATQSELTLLSFKIGEAGAWKVIPGYFEINQLWIDFVITNLTTASKRQVVGDLFAQFNVGSVPLVCELRNTFDDQDWTITAGLAPGETLDLVAVAVSLFDNQATLPSGLPTVTFSELSVTVTPQKQTFAFSAASTDNWELLPGLSLDGISTAFSYTQPLAASNDAPPSDGKLSGHVTATWLIAGVTLDISAVLNDAAADGWTFSGTQRADSNPIPIGELIQSLANIFGNVELPSVLRGLTVYDLSVSFNTSSTDFTFHCLLKDSAIPGLSLAIDIAITHKSPTEYQTKYSGTLTYSSDDVSMTFELDFVTTVATAGQSSKTVASYNAEQPPTLQQFLEMISDDLGWDVNLPAELNFDADLKSMKFEVETPVSGPSKVDGAGLFELTFGGGEPWSFYTSYSNSTYFENKGKDSRATGSDGQPAYVFGAALSGPLSLAQLPLIGDIPGIKDFSIDKLGFYYTDAPFTDTEKKLIFSVAELGTSTPLQPDPAGAFLSQPSFSLMSLFGDKGSPLDNLLPNSTPLGTSTGTPAAGTPPSFSAKANVPRKPISWLSVDKTIGPVSLDKIGLSFSGPPKGTTGELGILGIYVDGGFTISGFSMQLEGLGITFPLPAPSGSIDNPLDQIGFHLQGAAVQFQEPGLEISGAFLSLSDDDIDMVGDFIVKAGPFGVSAYGGFAGGLSDPSLFIFVHLQAPLGGPPFFFVNGVSGGFGLNRAYKLPTFAELPTYPLLPSAPAIPTASDLAGKGNQEKLDIMTNAMVGLATYFPVEDGQYWFALGLDVTSFEMIEVSAILSISFGNSLQFAVIGAAVMTLPVKEPAPLAYVQINFELSYSSSDDLLAVQGVVTPSSYIFDNLAQLTGGFAFYTWLGGPHSGDFVLTIGGYSDHYTPPSNYPLVPRVGIRANLGIVQMSGEAYFALVPNGMMAGLAVNVSADLGVIAAWFYAGADFYLGWKPFTYAADIGITVGARFTMNLGFVKVKITVHVGVILSLWGPGFGGQSIIDLDIISFTIRFGDAKKPAPPLNWTEFKDFLPSVPVSSGDPVQAQQSAQKPAQTSPQMMMLAATPETANAADTGVDPHDNDSTAKPLVNLYINDGLLQQYTDADRIDDLDWLVDANYFDIRTDSTAPCSALSYNGAVLADNYNYLVPGSQSDLAAQIASPAHDGQQAPYYVYQTPDGDTAWYDKDYGIPPMSLQNIQSTHIVTFANYVNGNVGDQVEDVVITLTTGNAAKSLWGNDAVSSTTAPATESTISNALLGLTFTPMIWSPKRTTYIPYYYLVFDSNDLFLEQAVAPVLNDTPYSADVTAQVYSNMQNGTAFETTQAPRASIVDLLLGQGFATLTLSNSSALSTQDYVADPVLVYMSSTSETNLSQPQ